jgi:hypothetical protein
MLSLPKIGSGEALTAATRERREKINFILIDLIQKQTNKYRAEEERVEVGEQKRLENEQTKTI